MEKKGFIYAFLAQVHLEMQVFRPKKKKKKNSEAEKAFQQEPQVIHMHIKFEKLCSVYYRYEHLVA